MFESNQDIVAFISCVLSIMGSLFMVSQFFSPSKRKKPAQFFLFWLSVSDLGSAAMYIIPGRGYDTYCSIQATVGIFFPVASFLWIDAIAYYLYAVILISAFKTPRQIQLLMITSHIVCWSIAIILAASVYLAGHAGYYDEGNTGFCSYSCSYPVLSSFFFLTYNII